MRFDENLRNLRKEKEYSQEYLAEKLGVTRQTISKWENGTAMPDLKKLIELADFFETSMDDLLGLDYKTMNPKQNFAEGTCNDYSEAEAIKANRYMNDLIDNITNHVHGKTKALSIGLAIVAVVLAITIISLSSKIGSLESQISGLNNTIFSFQEQLNRPSRNDYDNYYDYDVEVNVVKPNSEASYIVQTELKYAPSSYPKNSKIYYLIPKKDGGVDRVEAADNNGEFVAVVDIDLSIDKPVYFVLDDGENIVKQEVYFEIRDVYGGNDNYIQYDIVDKTNNEYLFTTTSPSEYVWNNSKYAELSSADIVALADGKEVYRQALKKSELNSDDYTTYYEMDLPSFTVKDLKKPQEFDIYVEVKLDNGVVCKEHLEHNKPMYYTEEGMEQQLSQSYIEYVFTNDDETVIVKGNK